MYHEPSNQTWTRPELSVVLAALVQGRRERLSPRQVRNPSEVSGEFPSRIRTWQVTHW